eukprot:14885942-Alexandrium_andersonii.AAC.1
MLVVRGHCCLQTRVMPVSWKQPWMSLARRLAWREADRQFTGRFIPTEIVQALDGCIEQLSIARITELPELERA